jgi:hypothetical protein
VHVASPGAALRSAGHDVRALDVSIEPWDRDLVEWADGVAFSVPMHTAMRMALALATTVRAQRPDLPICLYGLYAGMSRDSTVGGVADRVIIGEYEPALVAWADGTSGARVPASAEDVVVQLGRGGFETPARDLLPPLDRYARLVIGDEERLAGAVEASHGCSHRCRHCPLPVVYDGRLRVVPEQVVLSDVSQLVAMGARHITFGDPDFLNGPRHAVRVAQAIHSSFPDLSFDCTTKVEHILDHEDLWSGLAKVGCLFVVSAFESVDDKTLRILDKGHTAANESAAVTLLRSHGIEVRPSWLPFTPWTQAAEVDAMLDFVISHDLVRNVDAVQYTIRLLVPEGSLLLSVPEVKGRLEYYDATRLSWIWTSEDAGLDELQEELAALVEAAGAQSALSAAEDTFKEVDARVRVYMASHGTRTGAAAPRRGSRSSGPTGPRPRLSEPWFCCSEPTSIQRQTVGADMNDVQAEFGLGNAVPPRASLRAGSAAHRFGRASGPARCN